MFCHFFSPPTWAFKSILLVGQIRHGMKLGYLAETSTSDVKRRWKNLCPSCCDTQCLVALCHGSQAMTDGEQLCAFLPQWAIPPDSFAWPWQQSHCDSNSVDVSTLGRHPLIHYVRSLHRCLPKACSLEEVVFAFVDRLCSMWAGHYLTELKNSHVLDKLMSLFFHHSIVTSIVAFCCCLWKKHQNYQHTNIIVINSKFCVNV